MQWRNDARRYGLVAIAFHWLIAAGFLTMLGLGAYMTSLPLGDPNVFPLFQFHKSLGLTIFVAALLRLAWRAINVVPPLPSGLKAYERFLARLTHAGLYGVLLVMPMTGWVIVSASPYNIPTLIYGWVELPHISFVAHHANKDVISGWAENAHWALAWAGGAGVALHVAAALKHHLILRDDTLTRMLPARHKETP